MRTVMDSPAPPRPASSAGTIVPPMIGSSTGLPLRSPSSGPRIFGSRHMLVPIVANEGFMQRIGDAGLFRILIRQNEGRGVNHCMKQLFCGHVRWTPGAAVVRWSMGFDQ